MNLILNLDFLLSFLFPQLPGATQQDEEEPSMDGGGPVVGFGAMWIVEVERTEEKMFTKDLFILLIKE